jgi:hypothetical protein
MKRIGKEKGIPSKIRLLYYLCLGISSERWDERAQGCYLMYSPYNKLYTGPKFDGVIEILTRTIQKGE